MSKSIAIGDRVEYVGSAVLACHPGEQGVVIDVVERPRGEQLRVTFDGGATVDCWPVELEVIVPGSERRVFECIDEARSAATASGLVVRLAPLYRWIVVSAGEFERFGAEYGWELDVQDAPLSGSEIIARAAWAMHDMGFGPLVLASQVRRGVA